MSPTNKEDLVLRRTATALVVTGALAAGGTALLAPSAAASPEQSVAAVSAAVGVDPSAGAARARRLLTPERRRELRTTGHLSLTVDTRKRGTVTVLVQRGEVTALSPTAITLRSKDGFTHTYVVTDKTKVRLKGQPEPYRDLRVGERVIVVAVHTKAGDVARRIGWLRPTS